MSRKIRFMRKCACGRPKERNEVACPACMKELIYNMAPHVTPDKQIATLAGYISLDDYLGRLKKRGVGPTGKCAICGGNYVLGGHNPHPALEDEDARCCGRCNDNVVVTARDEEILRNYKKRTEAM